MRPDRPARASALERELTPLELREAIIRTAPYAGFPRALAALGALRELFASR
jgi:alkylhydroperoxidase/carboxymuconolactone decarboxylase family protein YurZ